MQATLDRLVARHETLRTRFELVDGEPLQKIAPADTRFPLTQQDLRALSNEAIEATLERLGNDNATQLFDLSQGPLVRGQLLQVADAEHVLLITLHHIVSDGWSNSVLAHEVSVLYNAFSQGQKDPLPALALQYVDYAAWQRQSLDGPALQTQVDFWRKHLEGAPSLLRLPLDRPRPAIQSYAGGIVDCAFSPKLSADLRAFSQAQGSTLFMVLLAGWSVMMSHLSGQTDVVVGTPVANRQRPELESLIGFFANTLALRVGTDHDLRVNDMLGKIKDLTLAAYSHQDLPAVRAGGQRLAANPQHEPQSVVPGDAEPGQHPTGTAATARTAGSVPGQWTAPTAPRSSTCRCRWWTPANTSVAACNTPATCSIPAPWRPSPSCLPSSWKTW